MDSLLKIGETFQDRFTVQLPTNSNNHYQSYRLIDENGEHLYLKIYKEAETGKRETSLLKSLKHSNIPAFIDKGVVNVKDNYYSYLIQEFISGETVAEYMSRNIVIEPYKINSIVNDILDALDYLHNLPEPLIHNNINNQNIMLDMAGTLPKGRLISFKNAVWFHQPVKDFSYEGVNHFYLAPECFKGVFSPQSDIFSVGVLIYHCLFGLPPWFVDISDLDYHSGKWKQVLEKARQKPLKQPDMEFSPQSNLYDVISKALQPKAENRFRSAKEFKEALNDEQFRFESLKKEGESGVRIFAGDSENLSVIKRIGNGFADIAGMQELKQILYEDVILALQNKERYNEFKVSIPNGILLYGPPRCGKTFFAERLAEESGFNFQKFVPGDLASIYIHGTQQIINRLFKEAQKKAPIMLYFDEIDGIMPQRGGHDNQGYDSEVNEFLVQLDNCSQRGIFFIGATNFPSKIDRAILKPGRIDKIFYIPPPDLEARKVLFEMYLKGRPIEYCFDYEELAKFTDKYSVGDIVLLVNEAARKSLITECPFDQKLVIEMIRKYQSTLSDDELNYYESLRLEIEGYNRNIKRDIGFRLPKKS